MHVISRSICVLHAADMRFGALTQYTFQLLKLESVGVPDTLYHLGP